MTKFYRNRFTVGDVPQLDAMAPLPVLPKNGLLAYYPFEGNANSLTGINTGTPINCTFGAQYGKNSQGVHMVGTGYIDCGNNSSLNFSSAFTIAGWYKANTTGKHFCMRKGTEYNTGWDIAGETYLLNMRSVNLSPVDNVSAANLFENGVWVHFGITYDSAGGANNFKFYKNGTLFSQRTTTGSLMTSSYPLLIGSAVGGTYLTNGDTDDLVLYNRALTAAEMLLLPTSIY